MWLPRRYVRYLSWSQAMSAATGPRPSPGPSRQPVSRLPFASGLVLPSAAAAELAVTATGATVAETAPAVPDLTSAGQAEEAQARDAQLAKFAVIETAAAGRQASAVQARAAEAQRIARNAEPAAAAKKKAAASCPREGRGRPRGRRGSSRSSGVHLRLRLPLGQDAPRQDFAAPSGTPWPRCRPARSSSPATRVYGYMVKIEYWDGTVSVFGHISRISSAWVTRSPPARPSATAATPATRPDPTCTSRSTPTAGRPSPPPVAAGRGLQ